MIDILDVLGSSVFLCFSFFITEAICSEHIVNFSRSFLVALILVCGLGRVPLGFSLYHKFWDEMLQLNLSGKKTNKYLRPQKVWPLTV